MWDVENVGRLGKPQAAGAVRSKDVRQRVWSNDFQRNPWRGLDNPAHKRGRIPGVEANIEVAELKDVGLRYRELKLLQENPLGGILHLMDEPRPASATDGALNGWDHVLHDRRAVWVLVEVNPTIDQRGKLPRVISCLDA